MNRMEASTKFLQRDPAHCNEPDLTLDFPIDFNIAAEIDDTYLVLIRTQAGKNANFTRVGNGPSSQVSLIWIPLVLSPLTSRYLSRLGMVGRY